MVNNIPKRKVGRPRNAEVDSLAAELGVTPRRVRQMQAGGELFGSVSGRAEPTVANAPTVASVRLRRALAEAARAELSLANEQLEARRAAGELMLADDAVRFIVASLEAVSQGLRNAPHRFAGRCNPENQEVSRRGLEALVCEVGVLVAAASKKVAETGTAL